MTDFRLRPGALDSFMRTSEPRRRIGEIGLRVRDRARVNATPISHNADAIIAVPGEDAQGVFVDVGYDKTHPGFVLWWHEVGTRNHPARPHLRPALSPRS